MPSAGYASTLKVSGPGHSFALEVMTDLGGGRWQITNAAHRIVDPSQPFIVQDNGPVLTLTYGTDYLFDPLFGIVTLTGYGPVLGALTFSGTYLDALPVAEVTKAQFSVQAAMLDKTNFDSAGWREFARGMIEWSGSADMYSQPTDDLDNVTAGAQSFFSFLTNGTPKLLELTRAGKMVRGWCQIESIENASELNGLVTASIKFKGAAQLVGAALAFE